MSDKPEELLQLTTAEIKGLLAAHELISGIKPKLEAHLAHSARGTIYDLELTVRTQNCLKAESILYIDTILGMGEQRIKALPNMGRKSMADLKDCLVLFGSEFPYDWYRKAEK